MADLLINQPRYEIDYKDLKDLTNAGKNFQHKFFRCVTDSFYPFFCEQHFYSPSLWIIIT